MKFYDAIVMPRLCDILMRSGELLPYRRRVAEKAFGLVLEIGIGSALNLPFYRPERVQKIIGLEPNSVLRAKAAALVANARIPIQLLDASADAIPLDDQSIDTVVTTWTLCSIPLVIEAVKEIHRVLKPGGKWLFVEHGLSPDESVRRWQNSLTPIWKRIAGGCHLNRPISALLESEDFAFDWLETAYMAGPRPMTYMYEGCARPT